MKRSISIILICVLIASFLSLSSAYSGYSDVASDAWYADAVEFVTDQGLFKGSTDGLFSPANTMTRAMFVTVVGRYDDAPVNTAGYGKTNKTDVNLRSAATTDATVLSVLTLGTEVPVIEKSGDWYKVDYLGNNGYIRNDLIDVFGSEKFADVQYGQYYTAYIDWAYKSSLVSGTSANTFSPDSGITREQICVVLHNYAKSKGISLNQKQNKVSFKDDDKISSWAKEAVYVLQQAGIVNGLSDGNYNPSASATRAEVAFLLMQFINETKNPAPQPTNPPSSERPEYPESPYDGYVLEGNVVTEREPVNDSYFDDACFIGHSIVAGMETYFNLSNADFYAVSGISASSMLNYSKFELSTTHEDEDGNTVKDTGTLEQVLSEKSGEYGKVYIMLGTNELSVEAYQTGTYYDNMLELVQLIKSSQPNAKIYLIATIPVSRDKSIHNLSYTRDNILAFNKKLMELSTNENVYYLDAFGLLADDNGYLPASACLADGIHILKPQYEQLKDFLLRHTIG